MRRSRILALFLWTFVAASMAGPRTVAAQKSSSGDEADVGLALFPFEVERSEDRSMAFALEAAVDKTLADLIGHPVHTGRSTKGPPGGRGGMHG